MDKIVSMINDYSVLILGGLAIITLLLFIMTIVLLVSVNKLKKRYKKMMRGIDNRNLEEVINSNLDRIEEAVGNSETALDECKKLSDELMGCLSKVSIMRYRAFENVGCDLSYSIAILDSYNNGVILTSIYSRQDSTTYAKPVNKGVSSYNLSEEEKHVLNEAINKK